MPSVAKKKTESKVSETVQQLAKTGVFVCEIYERLRSHILGSSSESGGAYGLGLMMMRGMAAWVEAVLERGPPEANRNASPASEAHRLQPTEGPRLSDLFASIIIEQCQLER